MMGPHCLSSAKTKHMVPVRLFRPGQQAQGSKGSKGPVRYSSAFV